MPATYRTFASFLFAAALTVAIPSFGQSPTASAQQDEARATRAYEAAVREGPPSVRAFLTDFPKGADLHVHLSGAIYAETFIREAGEDGICVDTVALSLAKPPCTGKLIPAKELTGNINSATQDLYDKLIDSFSMRGFVPTPGWTGHDQFFATFARFGGLKDHTAEWVDEVASRAAAQNQQYLELMKTPPFSHAAQIANAIGWSPELQRADREAFARFRQQLLDRGLRDEVAAGSRRGPPVRSRAQAPGTLRDPAGYARLPGRGPLHLPGPARLSAGTGLRANAARF